MSYTDLLDGLVESVEIEGKKYFYCTEWEEAGQARRGVGSRDWSKEDLLKAEFKYGVRWIG